MDKYFRKYVWNDERTPYRIPVARLTRQQAGYEMLYYATVTGVLFSLIALMALMPQPPHGRAPGVSLFAFTQVCAALLLWATSSIWSALYCASAPVAGLLYFAVFGFHPNLGAADMVLLVVAMLLWIWYARRLIAITRAYPSLASARDAPDSP